jgi:AcrR family transcriptional regulator
MTKSEQTRQFILEKTAPLFNTKGFDGTTLSDLERVTGLTKGSLYGNFEGKEDLASQAFRHSMQKVKAKVRHEMEVHTSFKDRLLALLNFYSKYVFNPPIQGGCPLLNSAVEADDYRTSMRRVVVEELHSTVRSIESLIRSGMRAGEFKKNIKPHEIAYTLFCLVEGGLMFSRAERSDEAMKIVVKHCKTIVNQISIA